MITERSEGRLERITTPTQAQEDREQTELIKTVFIPLWEQWQDEFIAAGAEAKREVALYTKAFCEYSGAKEQAPYTYLFLGFCAGVDNGVKLCRLMDEAKPEEPKT